MYASLDKMDIVVDEDDGKLAVQTDHRDAAEIDADWDLSVVFLAARALNPQRTGGYRVRVTFLGEPSEPYLALVAKAGAEAERAEDRSIRPAAPDDPALDESAAAALRRIGSRVLIEIGQGDDEAGVDAVLRELDARQASFGGKSESEIAYWTAVVEAGAAVGEALIRRHGLAWKRDPKFFGVVPYMIGSPDGSLTNVFDKVERYFEHGESESPLALFGLVEDTAGGPDGPLMFNLRPAAWGGAAEALCRPLLERGGEVDDADIPLVALVRDLPSSVANLPATTPDADRPALEAEALANLRAVEVALEPLDVGVPILLVHGDYYAAEKLLDPEFMAILHRRLDSELLAAVVPVKGRLFVMDALVAPERVGALGLLATGQHDEAPPNQRLSTEIFLVSEGRVVGLARAKAEPGRAQGDQAPRKKGFWARLFGW